MLLILGAIGLAAASCCCCPTADEFKSLARLKASQILDRAAYTPAIPTQAYRSGFNGMSLIAANPTKNYHTHPNIAAQRSAAVLQASHFALTLGHELFSYQCSAADQRNDRLGSRVYYWAKDVASTPSDAAPKQSDIIYMGDVDYYVDMNKFMLDNFQPILLYTFMPTKAAAVHKEYSFFFDREANVHYNVSGGGSYVHQVWSYHTDFVIVREYWGNFITAAATFNVDRRLIGDDHYFVLLTPVKRWRWTSAWITFMLCGNNLKRLNPVEGEFVRIDRVEADGPSTSIGRVGEYIEATIPSTINSAIGIIAENSKIGLTNPQVLSMMPEGEKPETRVSAAVVYDYHKNTPCKDGTPVVFPLSEAVQSYQFSPKDYDPDAKPSLVPFMDPVISGGCYAPAQTKANEARCVQARIKDVKSDAKPTAFLYKVMREFSERFIPNSVARKGRPVDDEYVYAQQDRPSQRRILAEAEFSRPRDRHIAMFVKKEAYTDIKDPRPISQINGNDKADYSRYMYAIADYIKLQNWYAFGRTPVDIADRITEICKRASEIFNSDFKKFDGHLSKVLRELESIIFMRFFSNEYHADITRLHDAQFNLPARGRMGTKYDVEFQRCSGSPETSLANTIANAFVAFLAFRMTKVNGRFLSADEAYSKLGLYGGDDGVTADVDPEKYVKAAKMVGQEIDVEGIKRGQPGVKFLARIYSPNVWFGDNTSCCDLYRQLSKFHTTVSLPPNVTPVEKLVEKARAYCLTDANTPVLGPLCVAIVSHQDALNMPDSDNLRIWNSDVRLENQYPNAYGPWMVDYVNKSLPDFRHDLFYNWLKPISAGSPMHEFLTPPVCLVAKEPDVKIPVVVNHEVKYPKRAPTQTKVWKTVQKAGFRTPGHKSTR